MQFDVTIFRPEKSKNVPLIEFQKNLFLYFIH
jgi:hypothetical protein